MNCSDQERQVIEWLRNYNAYKCGIENLNELVEDIAQEGMGIDYSKDKLSSSNAFSSIVESAVIRLDGKNIQRRIKAMENVVHAIDKSLSKLSERERKVVMDKYINGKPYYQICYELYICERTAKYIRSEAIRKMTISMFGVN